MGFLLLQSRRKPHIVKLDPGSLFEPGLLVGDKETQSRSVQGPCSAHPRAGGSDRGIFSEKTWTRSSAELPVHCPCSFSVCKEPDCFARCNTFS